MIPYVANENLYLLEDADTGVPADPAFYVAAPQFKGVITSGRDRIVPAGNCFCLVGIQRGKGRTAKNGKVFTQLNVKL